MEEQKNIISPILQQQVHKMGPQDKLNVIGAYNYQMPKHNIKSVNYTDKQDYRNALIAFGKKSLEEYLEQHQLRNKIGSIGDTKVDFDVLMSTFSFTGTKEEILKLAAIPEITSLTWADQPVSLVAPVRSKNPGQLLPF